ncbi:hypothetical protein [Fructobacillus fructosus]|uniref:hypothetical protein n=1 Tax=Fructobacillus fructosus TaxID=1631 RepID=UPI0030C8238C
MMIVTAYHGTSRKNARKILTEGFRIEKGRQRYPNDLGHGIYGYLDSSPEKGDVYFMQTAKENALLFAKQIRKVPEKQIVVLKLTIQIDIQNYLDLNQLVNRNHVLHLYQKIIGGVLRDIKKEYVSDRISRRRQMDGVVLEKLNQVGIISLPPVVIKDTFTRFNGILSNFTNGREIVIRDPRYIHFIEAIEEQGVMK